MVVSSPFWRHSGCGVYFATWADRRVERVSQTRPSPDAKLNNGG
jgi:hypothetical protein